MYNVYIVANEALSRWKNIPCFCIPLIFTSPSYMIQYSDDTCTFFNKFWLPSFKNVTQDLEEENFMLLLIFQLFNSVKCQVCS